MIHRHWPWLGAIAIAASLGAVAGAWGEQRQQKNDWFGHWPADLQAEKAAPNNHKILYEDGHVRLMAVTTQPGEIVPRHAHNYPSVFIYDAAQPALEDTDENNQTREIPRRYVGADFPLAMPAPPQAPHIPHNVDTFPLHFYRLEFKKIDGDSVMSMKKYPR